MAKKRHTAEQITAKLREAEVLLAKGTKMPQVCPSFLLRLFDAPCGLMTPGGSGARRTFRQRKAGSLMDSFDGHPLIRAYTEPPSHRT